MYSGQIAPAGLNTAAWGAFVRFSHQALSLARSSRLLRGLLRLCLSVDGFRRCVQIIWPETWFAHHRPLAGIVSWHGSLLEDKQDAGGTLYRRDLLPCPRRPRFATPPTLETIDYQRPRG
jgi:hypothetical protein